jgi:peptidoglycan/xylan/chitin deacetylase (PgdA/CDA1 family)
MPARTAIVPLLTFLLVAAAAPAGAADERCTRSDDREPAGLHRRDVFERGHVVLTFDDGPYEEKTPPVLDLLDNLGLSASFFVLGRNINRRTYRLLQRMEADGHIIASHSYNHDVEMASRNGKAVEYIRGQHELTRILIEMALLARSPDDFDALYTRVFARRPNQRLDANALRSHWSEFVERHDEVLIERNHAGGRYRVLYSRPPGGGPYLGNSVDHRGRYDRALQQLGMLNVMWHGESGDVHVSRARDYGFLSNNITSMARRGGVLLIHDYILFSALSSAMRTIAADPDVRVISLDEATTRKYGCTGR